MEKFFIKILLISALLFTGCTDEAIVPEDNSAPELPLTFTAKGINPTTIQLQWTASTTPQDKIESYIISIIGRNDIILPNSIYSYDVKELTPDSTYSFVLRVKGINASISEGISVISSPLPNAPEPATNLAATAINEQTVRLKWTHSPSAKLSKFIGYEVRVQDDNKDEIYLLSIPKTDSIFDVEGLRYGTKYIFSLKARSNTVINNLSSPATIQWQTAKRYENIRIYERWGISLEDPTKRLDSADSYLADLALSVSYSPEIGNPNHKELHCDIYTRTSTFFSNSPYGSNNIPSIILDDLYDTELFQKNGYAPTEKKDLVYYATSVGMGFQAFLFYAKTKSIRGKYAKILVKNGPFSGTQPNRYLEADILVWGE